jgi:hypothetical protein
MLFAAVAAVQPDGAVTVVADAAPPPVVTVRSSKYHGLVSVLFEYVIVTIAVPAAGVYVNEFDVNPVELIANAGGLADPRFP